MYIRSPHRVENVTEILDFVRRNEFASLVTFDGTRPVATHVLLAAEEDADSGEIYLEGHLARANPQWRAFDETKEVLAIFFGAHAYLSPTWYQKPDENVPTWNYAAAHLYGTPRVVSDRTELADLMRRLVGKYESGTGYSLDRLPPEYLEKQLQGIVGFRIRVTRMECSFKLAQTLDPQSHASVVARLSQSPDQNAREIAEAMRERRAEK